MVKRPFPSNKDCSVPASSLITAVVICIPGFSFAKIFFGISDNTLSALCSGASVDASSVCDVSFSFSASCCLFAFDSGIFSSERKESSSLYSSARTPAIFVTVIPIQRIAHTRFLPRIFFRPLMINHSLSKT